MLITIEYPIVTKGKPKKSTKEKVVVFRDVVVVDIPSYGPEVLIPAVVAELPSRCQVEYLEIEGQLYGRTGENVPADGRIHYTIGSNYSGSSVVADLAAELMDLGKQLYQMHSTGLPQALHPPELAEHFLALHRRGGAVIFPRLALPALDELEMKAIDMEDVERQRAAFLKSMSRFVVADDTILIATPEPVYGVRLGYRDHTDVFVEVLCPDSGTTVHADEMYGSYFAFFRGDQLEEALQYAELLKTEQIGNKAAAIVNGPHIPIDVRSHSLSFDGESSSLMAMAGRMLTTCLNRITGWQSKVAKDEVRAGLEKMPIEVMVAWKHLTDAMQSNDADRIAEAMKDCLAVQTRTGADYFSNVDYSPEMINITLDRWDNREVQAPSAIASIKGDQSTRLHMKA